MTYNLVFLQQTLVLGTQKNRLTVPMRRFFWAPKTHGWTGITLKTSANIICVVPMLETWQLPVSRADVNIYIMYMRGTSHVSGSPVLLFFCWWYSLLESHWMCDSNKFSNYGYVSVDIRKKRKVWFKYRDMYCSCTDPERFVGGGPTLTKVF